MTSLDFTILNAHWISSNDRLHWADKARRTKVLRQYGHAVALSNGTRFTGTVHVAAFIGYPRAGRADPANAADTVKGLIDGMTDAGMFIDDDSAHILGPTFLRGDKCAVGTHTVRLVITDQEIPW